MKRETQERGTSRSSAVKGAAVNGVTPRRNKGIARQRKEQRRAEAAERQERRDARSLPYHLRLLDNRPGNSAKERARLGAKEAQ